MGAEVDIVTGSPIDPVEAEMKRNASKYNHLNDQKARSDQLSESLKSEVGQTVLYKIEEQLLSRVNVLISKDEQCLALKKLLVNMGIELDVGKRAVEGLMRLVVRK